MLTIQIIRMLIAPYPRAVVGLLDLIKMTALVIGTRIRQDNNPRPIINKANQKYR